MASRNRKKLIEVALPLEAINTASAREKSIRHGHPSTLHLWWARRPLAAARAVIFSQMVDDPSTYSDELLANVNSRTSATEELERRRRQWNDRKMLYEKAGLDGPIAAAAPGLEPTLEESAADLERERLFAIIRQLVVWENTTNESVLAAAREEIWKSWRRTCRDNKDHPRAEELFDPEKLPAFHDPFAGGGAIPLEAQRLGMDTYASDLNPIAVLINKGMIEIPPLFAGRPPINPNSRMQETMAHDRWHGAQGLASDVRFYGKWMRDEAEKRIGDLYPKIEITADLATERSDLQPLIGRKLTVVAWLWARTVKSPNPAFASVDVPLASTFMLSTKAGKEAYVEPLIQSDGYRFSVRPGKPSTTAAKNGTKLARGANFQCLMSGTPIASQHIYSEANAGRMGARMMSIVVESERGRVYVAPTAEMEAVAHQAKPTFKPELPMADNPRWFSPPLYGLKTFGDLFTPRQLVALTTFSDLVQEARERVKKDALAAAWCDDGIPLEDGGASASGYADAVATYLAFAVSKAADRNTSLCFWENAMDRLRGTFGRQVLPMIWDYAETNPFAGAGGDIYGTAHSLCEVLDNFSSLLQGHVSQADAAAQCISEGKVVSTDPPYYDNIGYADLSDFFYVWLRRSLKSQFADLFDTLAVPKAEELVATPYRHGGKAQAEEFFMAGMTRAMQRLAELAHPAFPVTIYYAFKQSETEKAGTASTGWEMFLGAVIQAGFAITGTWPIRTEQLAGLKGNINALASSIVLVCCRRAADAAIATRREFIQALKSQLPLALTHLQRGNIAPVDLAQAAIGPGMAVYSSYSKVLDASGNPLPVHEALALINQTLDEVLAEQEGDFDAETRWALAWFEQSGFTDGEFGTAELLSKAKNTSVQGMKNAGILDKKSLGGKVRLLAPSELSDDWDPRDYSRLTIWEVVHHLVRLLETGGEAAAAQLVSILGGVAEVARELAYRLYTICERKKRAPEALSYNALVQSWPEIIRLAREQRAPQVTQAQMFQ